MAFHLFRPRSVPLTELRSIKYGGEAGIEMIGYSMTDCLRWLDGMSRASADLALNASAADAHSQTFTGSSRS